MRKRTVILIETEIDDYCEWLQSEGFLVLRVRLTADGSRGYVTFGY